MPQLFRIGKYIIYFWSNEINRSSLSMFMSQKVIQYRMPPKYGLLKMGMRYYAIIIHIFRKENYGCCFE